MKARRSTEGMNAADAQIVKEMALPEGKTCSDCSNVQRCTMLFGVERDNVECDFWPSRFMPAPPVPWGPM
jgi:hypothetical protein